MNLEEMLRQERDGIAPNPLLHRTDDIITRVRRRRRGHAAAASVVSLAVVAVMALGARQLLPEQTAFTPAGKPSPSHTATQQQGAPPRELPDGAGVKPGRYLVDVTDADDEPLRPVLTVPTGYDGIGNGVRSPDWANYVWVWNVHSVYTHPCDANAVYEPVGPSVADLASALAGQPQRVYTAPVPVTVGGYDGLYLELPVPSGVNPKTCPSGGFMMWPGRGQTEPGRVDLVWILDVDGQRIVIDASHLPTASPAKVAELKDMVTSASFVPREGP